MISGIGQQDVNFCARANNSGAAVQTAYLQQGGVDTVEFAGKKKGKAKKGILATVGAAVVAAGALIWGVKSGRLKKVENPTNILGRLQNAGYAVGSKGSQALGWCKGKATDLFGWVKGKFGSKKATEAVADKVVEKASNVGQQLEIQFPS